MSFFNGRASFLRFRVDGPDPDLFGEAHLAALAANAIGKQTVASADGVEVGFTAGGDILDTTFALEKNVVDDMLFFAMRIDSQKLPTDLLKAYYQADLRALCAGNPSGRPSKRQKLEAKESARDRLEHEAKDGRFLKRKAIECLWDRRSNTLLYGATSMAQVDRFASLFKRTFGMTLAITNADSCARSSTDMLCAVDDSKPALFIPSAPYDDVAWVLGQDCRDFLGNEFLLWLWFVTETGDDTFSLSDGSDVTLMFSGGLRLECPRGQTGNDTINHEGPTRLPEARKAIQHGKLPRKAGLILVRHDQQYSLTLLAETLGVNGAKLPKLEEESEQGRLVERVGHIRELVETTNLLFSAFCRVRLGGEWAATLAEMQAWLSRGERREAA